MSVMSVQQGGIEFWHCAPSPVEDLLPTDFCKSITIVLFTKTQSLAQKWYRVGREGIRVIHSY